jgi:tRNA(fMet)-specific endonuclease VapC
VIILDTDLLSIVQRAEGQQYENLVDRLDVEDDEVAVSIISFEEQMRGWLAFIARAKATSDYVKGYSRVHALLDDFITRPVLDFDESCASEFDRLIRSKVRVGTMDLRIAATAIAHDALLLSKNLIDFRKVPGLRVDDWSVREQA